MTTLLLELVQLPVMIAPPTSPCVEASWQLAEPTGSSNHLPTIIEINHNICYQPVIPIAATWQCSRVDWSCFTNKVRMKMNYIPPGITIHIQLVLFTCLLPMYLEGFHNHSITKSWEISQ